jgi:hypothetical protein
MLVQIWQADSVPKEVPEFVDPHITIDHDSRRKTRRCYLFEVDPSHEVFSETKDPILVARRLLLEFGFKNPSHLITAEKPEGLTSCNCPACCQPPSGSADKRGKKPRGFNEV